MNKIGKSVLGWFVVREDEGVADEAAPEVVALEQPQKPKAAAAPVAKTPLSGAVPTVAAGRALTAAQLVDVYRAAKISTEAQERVTKARALLESLPAGTPEGAKRQIVEASLKAFGVPIEEIAMTSTLELQALDAYVEHGARHTQSVLTDAQARIEKLQAEIAEIKKLMELQVTTQQGLAKSCGSEKANVQRVLEFFGQESQTKVMDASTNVADRN